MRPAPALRFAALVVAIIVGSIGMQIAQPEPVLYDGNAAF